MIQEVKADIFKVKSDVIVHQANCFHTMGSGIACFIRENFPEAYLADCQTKRGAPEKLGTFSFARVKNDAFPDVKVIVNLYSQFDFGREFRCTRYDAMVEGLTLLRDKLRAKAKGQRRTVAIPFRMGSNLGGGDWRVVRAIIESVFGDEPDFDVLICDNTALTDTLLNKASK